MESEDTEALVPDKNSVTFIFMITLENMEQF